MEKGFIFDLDGTVYLDNSLIDGASDTIRWLRERGDKVVFLTNKSIESISTYVNKLNLLGIEVSKEDVISSNYLVASYLKTKLCNFEKVLVIGEKPLLTELREIGILTTENSDEASYVVIGWDREFTYNKLNNAYQAWRNGAKIIATNPDRTCPMKGGQVPDCGAMIGAIEGATGEKIELILGKPSSLAAQFIVNEIIKLPPDQCYIVGDRLETDIKMGQDCGINSILVLTGITNKHMIENSLIKPKMVLDSIKEIINL